MYLSNVVSTLHLMHVLLIQIIQKHINGREDFNKNCKDYEEGFGDLGSGYWIGKLIL